MLELRAIDHIGIATPSLDEGLALYGALFGLEIAFREALPAQQVEVVMLRCGDQGVELLAPLSPEGPVGKFLAERGPGMHHVAYRVPDLVAALQQAAADGLQLIDSTPRVGAGGHRVAFLHPRSTGRVLIELVEAH
jgi:methylmalonyl-CoA/ethylmalonyl-CoA epimerase